MAEPSNPMPSANAPSSSAGATAIDFSVPSTSVNQSRTNLMSRSSSVRSTNSSCLSTTITLDVPTADDDAGHVGGDADTPTYQRWRTSPVSWPLRSFDCLYPRRLIGTVLIGTVLIGTVPIGTGLYRHLRRRPRGGCRGAGLTRRRGHGSAAGRR